MPTQSAIEYVGMQFFRLFSKLPLRGLIHLVSQTGNFTDYFKGFEKNCAVRRIFGEETEQILKNLKVNFIWFGYMGVDDNDGHLLVNKRYLSTEPKKTFILTSSMNSAT